MLIAHSIININYANYNYYSSLSHITHTHS
jgi:hypothetical protein